MISETGENLVFIFSLPRSGSTLLGAILGNHSQVHCPPEPWILLRLFDVYGEPAEGRVFDDYVASKAVRSFLSQEEFVASARLFARAVYNNILAKTNSCVLVDKTPRYYHILDFVQELFPQAKKIWLKRNPLDVAASYKVNWHRGIDVLTGETLDPMSADFLLGLFNLQRFFDEESPEKYEIKYEDLVEAPEQEIRKLSEFCGIEFEKPMIEIDQSSKGMLTLLNSEFGDQKIKESSQIYANSVGYWQQHLDSSEIKRLTSLLGRRIFTRMGYERVVTDHEDFFVPDVGEEILAKARARILDKFQVLRTVQMGIIYDNESKLRWHEKDRETKQQLLQQQEQELQAVRAETQRLSESVALLESQLKSLETEQRDLTQAVLRAADERQQQDSIHRERIARLQTEIQEKDAQYRALRASRSYRLGRVLLFPFAKLRDWVRKRGNE